MQQHCPMRSGREPSFEIEFGYSTPYMDALNRYNFNCKGDNFCVEGSLTCYFLKTPAKFDHFQKVSDWGRTGTVVSVARPDNMDETVLHTYLIGGNSPNTNK